MEFPGDSVSQGSSVATAVAWVAAMAQIQSLAPELPQAVGAAKKKKKQKRKKKKKKKKKNRKEKKRKFFVFYFSS